jgi:hypothetical protein
MNKIKFSRIQIKNKDIPSGGATVAGLITLVTVLAPDPGVFGLTVVLSPQFCCIGTLYDSITPLFSKVVLILQLIIDGQFVSFIGLVK